MSDLLNSASLVMIPSGYKEDTVFSAIPTDGSGDLSFTRASNGTRVNSAGLVEVCPWNLISNSENFNAATWYQENITPTTGQSDPLGANNAFKFLETSATGEHYFFYLFLALNDGVVTQSIYVKSEGRNQILFGATGSLNSFIFTFSTETISSVTGFTSTSATNVGNGWYRLTGTFIASSPINLLFVKGYNGGISYAGDTSKGFYAFGGQLNIGSTAKPYFPTTDRLNVPRLTYQNGGGGCPSLLLEKQSTNFIFPSNGDNGMAFNGTYTANAILSPEGVVNGFSFLVTPNSNGGLSMVTITTSAQSYTFSAYLKGTVNGQKVQLRGDLNGIIEEFTLTTDWVRYTKTFTGSVGAQSIYLLNGTYITPTQNNLYYGYGLQLEASSYATSLINTTSASATRVADACSKTGISSLIGQTEGVIFFDGYFGNEADEMYTIIQNSLGNGVTSSMYLIKSSSSIKFQSYDSSTTIQWDMGGGSFTIGQRIKIAGAYKANDIVLYVNGVQIATDTSATIPTCTALQIGVYPASPTANFQYNGKVNQAILFPTRLTNAELASLTTI